MFAVLSPAVTEQIHARVVGVARERGVARGRKVRVDTTVVESHVHYPTDSTLLGDGIRVLTRGLVRIAAECRSGAVDVVDHGRAVKHRLLEINRAAKSLTTAGRQRLRDGYAKLVALTRRVVRQTTDVLRRLAARRAKVVGDGLRVDAYAGELRHYVPLVEQVIAQTNARVWGGDRHVPGKILSLFEPHTQVIRKGKAHKPNEFGRLVRLDEV
ncbi:MAG TPA: ISNCY family transposase, partial [Gemmatimonadaceae bacterium]|nr:ISNCY family transposase [Gemmatimonadaceae bacterium]